MGGIRVLIVYAVIYSQTSTRVRITWYKSDEQNICTNHLQFKFHIKNVEEIRALIGNMIHNPYCFIKKSVRC